MSVLAQSALFNELKELSGFSNTSDIIANPVITILGTQGLCQSELFRYTRAVLNGYIHIALKDFSKSELLVAKDLIEFWQFPVGWSVAIDEEVAFREFQTTGILQPILSAKAQEITCRLYPHPITAEMVFDTHNSTYLGRIGSHGKYTDPATANIGVAVRSGYLELVCWFHDNGCKLKSGHCSSAARWGHLHILRWLREAGCPWNSDSYMTAAEGGHLTVLDWLIENGCPTSNSFLVCRQAAEQGQLKALQWAREHGFSWDQWVCHMAAAKGHLEVLKWVHENGCPWNEWTCARAAEKGQLEVLKWLREAGCPWSKEVIFWATKDGHDDVVKWALENGCPTEQAVENQREEDDDEWEEADA